MGYFSNGTDGDSYFEAYCSRCVHDDEGNCPVWNLHLNLNSQQHSDDQLGRTVKDVLSRFIPRERIGNAQCRMFVAKAASADLFEAAL